MASGTRPAGESKEEKVSERSLVNAEKFLQSSNYGRAFAHYLLVLKLTPNKKADIKENFTLALREWSEQLEKSGRVKDLFNCYEQACELFPECETMLNNMGAQLFRLGYVDEAACFFRRSLKLDPDYLGARENLENICGHLVERWHFRMLNDRVRNEAYRGAIATAVGEGFDTVLDIGTGTGLLSMLAAEAGARVVYGCDMSKTMYEMSCDVVLTNQMSQKIHLLHSKSSDLQIPEDIPERVSLVVTEIFDVALLGEGVLPALHHAWNHLMKTPGFARVIPGGATMYVCAVESDYIREHNRFLYPGVQNIDFQGVRLECKTSHSGVQQSFEPYTSERLDMIPGGCRILSQPMPFVHFNFNDPECIEKFLRGCSQDLLIPVLVNGRLDAVATWFDLHLDSDVSLSTAPGSGSCWEQALFPILPSQLNDETHNMLVRKTDKIELSCSFASDYLKFSCKSIHSSSAHQAFTTKPSSAPTTTNTVIQGDVASNASVVNSNSLFSNGDTVVANANTSGAGEVMIVPVYSRHQTLGRQEAGAGHVAHGFQRHPRVGLAQAPTPHPPPLPTSIFSFDHSRYLQPSLHRAPPASALAVSQLRFGDLGMMDYLEMRPVRGRFSALTPHVTRSNDGTSSEVSSLDETSSSDDMSLPDSQHSNSDNSSVTLNNHIISNSNATVTYGNQSITNGIRPVLPLCFDANNLTRYQPLPTAHILYPATFTSGNATHSEEATERKQNMVDGNIASYENTKTFTERFYLNRSELWKLNDLHYNRSLCSALQYLVSTLGEFKLLTFCDGVPIIALQALQLGVSDVCLVNNSSHEPLLHSIAANNGLRNNRLQFVNSEDIETLEGDFEALLVELIDEGGCLHQRVLEDVALARATCLESQAVVVPGRVTVQAMLIESYSLRQDSMVTSDDNTLGFLIAGFMNDFQMTTHCGIDLSVLDYESLSQPFELLTFDLNEFTVGEVPSYLDLSNTSTVRATETGTVHAILYWFDLHLIPGVKVSSLDSKYHWKQAAIIEKIPIVVSTGSTLRVKSMCRNNCIHASLALILD